MRLFDSTAISNMSSRADSLASAKAPSRQICTLFLPTESTVCTPPQPCKFTWFHSVTNSRMIWSIASECLLFRLNAGSSLVMGFIALMRYCLLIKTTKYQIGPQLSAAWNVSVASWIYLNCLPFNSVSPEACCSRLLNRALLLVTVFSAAICSISRGLTSLDSDKWLS